MKEFAKFLGSLDDIISEKLGFKAEFVGVEDGWIKIKATKADILAAGMLAFNPAIYCPDCGNDKHKGECLTIDELGEMVTGFADCVTYCPMCGDESLASLIV